MLCKLCAVSILCTQAALSADPSGLVPSDLRCEHLESPLAVESPAPRLSWKLASDRRGARQSAYRIIVASRLDALDRVSGDVGDADFRDSKALPDAADLWDSGKVESAETLLVPYAGKRLGSRQECWWRVRAWDEEGRPSGWSAPASWTMGLLEEGDWEARFISFRDESPLHADRGSLHLPPARYYRKEFRLGGGSGRASGVGSGGGAAGRPADRTVRRALLHASALGIFELHLNGRRVGDAWFEPGWSDYARRAYYRTHDVTGLLARGPNAIGAIVADGWYAGYLGYALLVGYGPNRAGRSIYGKTPAFLAQIEIEYEDGSREIVPTDASWKTTGEGPVREADFLMGEAYDARRELRGWSEAGFDDGGWESAVLAEANGSTRAVFHDQAGDREVELGFVRPGRLQAYPAPAIRVTGEIRPIRMTEPAQGTAIFDLGQNIAGVVRLRVRGTEGTTVRVRHGEMLHPDGRLMTENLRRARATDTYVLRGDPDGETWTPRFTYHGFQYVEVTGLPEPPDLSAVTGLVVHSDTPLASSFECSDDVANRIYQNVVWTQRANFVEVPTDCPQRDERFGWTGDAQIFVRAAAYNADVAAFFTKWMDDLEEAQRSFGAYPDYAPYPMTHGRPGKSFATGWMDAGIICPWTIWRVYGDTGILERHHDSFTRFMEFRQAISPGFLGVAIGNGWGDWLSLGETTPVEYIDACYHARTARLMSEISAALGKRVEAADYLRRLESIRKAFREAYVEPDGSLRVPTQTAYALALSNGLVPEALERAAADRLARMVEENGYRMATGFLGTQPLLPVLSAHGHHDLAVRLFQSRRFPSWGYEVVNGATTIWERWDSYTKDDAFGRHNAAMNSFSHYAFGAVCEWMFRSLVGIDAEEPGFRRILIRPGPPSPGSNPEVEPIRWVKARHESPRGTIRCDWRRTEDAFELEVRIPANTSATVEVPATGGVGERAVPEGAVPEDGHPVEEAVVTEGGRPLEGHPHVEVVGRRGGRIVLRIASGAYSFRSVAR